MCGKEITCNTQHSEYKIKKHIHLFDGSWWTMLNVHDECVEKLYNAVKSKEPIPPTSGSNIVK